MPTTGRGPENGLRVLFMGTPTLAVPTLQAVARHHRVAAVLSQPDRPAGRGRRLRPSPVKIWALEHEIDVLQPPTLRDPATVRRLECFDPDVAVVVAYGLLLPPEVLDVPRLGCVNLHASLLPLHRGASPIRAAILAGDTVTGVTTMLMDRGLDTGPLLLQRQLELRDDDTCDSLGARLADVGAELMLRTLAALATGAVRPRPQDESRATMTRLVSKRDGRIDWRQTGVEIDRRVRAMQPWPGAWTEWGEERLRIFAVQVAGAVAQARPGQVIRADEELLVACGDGLLSIRELQRPGGRRLTARAFLHGAPGLSGQTLGRPD